MAEELQGLLNKINQDGIEKAEVEKQRIINAAKDEAAKLILEAKAEAENIVKNAQATAAADEKRGRAAVEQAGRDIVIKLRQELQSRLQAVVKDCAGKALSPELMAGIIRQMTEKFQPAGTTAVTLDALVAAKDVVALEQALRGGIATDLQQNPRILESKEVSAGLKIGFNNGDLYFDFTDDAIAELICAYIGPRLAEMVKNG